LHLPQLPLERFLRRIRHGGGWDEATPDAPLALVESGARGTVLTAANAAARRAGAAPGRMLPDARAACPALAIHPADRPGDAALLRSLAAWAMRWSPIAAVDSAWGEHALMLDVTGCTHLFGGEARLVADARRRFAAAGFTLAAGLASTPMAARLVARCGLPDAVLPAGDEAFALDACPVEALGLPPQTVLLLRRLGLKTLGQVKAVPRAALERRFRNGEAAFSVRVTLDRLSGGMAEAVDALHPAEPLRFTLSLAEPMIDAAGVAFALDDLLVKAAHRLEQEGLGARGFTLTAFHADGGTAAFTVRLSAPARDVPRIARLFAPRLAEIDCGHGVDAFVLAAHDAEVLALKQAGAVLPRDGDPGRGDAHFCDGLAPLIDTLSNRLGPEHVFMLQPRHSHWPARAQRRVAAGCAAAALADEEHQWEDWRQARAGPQGAAPRPFRLFDRAEPVEVIAEVPDGPPMRFVWRRVTRRIARAAGPERIAPEWWRADAQGLAVRDYYAVEDEEGRRFWLYRAGPYGGAEPPRWFVHGVFA
jgi:protein ImuB